MMMMKKSFWGPRKSVGGLLGLVVLLAVFPAPAHAYPRPGITERVSVASDGAEAESFSNYPAISADDRYFAFSSDASNLVPGDNNAATDVFVHDRATGATERVSVASAGAEAESGSFEPAISADGRHVAFSSDASNLVPGDTNGTTGGDDTIGTSDLFVHDRATGATERVSVASDGAEANSFAYSVSPAISADGRHVAGATERVSVAPDGAQANFGSFQPAISADGRHVAFHSYASNLVPGDTNAATDVFVHDRTTGATERVSVTSDGAEADFFSVTPAISADGRHVAFSSTASNLVPGDTNVAQDVFVNDRATGATERVSVASDGAEAESGSFEPAIGADGRHVAFSSDASNLVPADTNGAYDVFVRDRATGATERVSVASDGVQANSISYFTAISPDGRHVAFGSTATNLVPGDTNGAWDVFVRDRGDSPGVVGTPSVLKVPGGVGVSGRATFSGATLAGATDPDDDGTAVGPVGAADVGAELTGASLIYRPEDEDLLVRLRLASLPSVAVQNCSVGCRGASTGAGAPAILYGLEFDLGGTRYEVRAFRAGATSATPRAPYVALYRCDPDCTEHAQLTGSFGTTGEQVLVSVPLSALGAPEGTELTGLRAFTALGEATPGALHPLDEVPLSSSVIPASRVELGIAPASTPEDQVAFSVEADLLAGDFSGTIPTAGLSPGSYRVWARACLGDACGPAAFEEVAL